MTEEAVKTLGAGLIYEDRVPVSWRAADGQALGSTQQANEEFLRAVSALEEQRAELEEEHPEIMRELHRLESKIDFLLELMGKVLAAQMALPEPAHIRLSGEAIEWLAAQAPAPGANVLLDVYLIVKVPHPLVLPGQVQSVQAEAGGFRVTAVLGDLGEPVRDWMEKMIFRQHRRRIAASRGPRSEKS